MNCSNTVRDQVRRVEYIAVGCSQATAMERTVVARSSKCIYVFEDDNQKCIVGNRSNM